MVELIYRYWRQVLPGI